MTIKNQIVRLHRWFGLTMCIFFVAWFFSGFVMMYADFPQYSRKERLLHQASLPPGLCRFIPAQLNQRLMQDSAWKSIRLNMLLGRPVLRMQNVEGEQYSFYADNGSPVQRLSAVQARAIAISYFSGRYSPLMMEEMTELDQWIPRSAFLSHMPIYRVRMNDPAETVIYISSVSGEILQVHTLKERVLAWCGPIIHWIYPKELILHRPLWRFVVILFSALGMFASFAGIIAGLIRVKKKKKSYVSPYRAQWYRWHHYTGFIFGVFTFTWVFSGLLTMSPFGWSHEADITAAENRKLQGGNLMIKSYTQAPGPVFTGLKNGFAPVEMELKRFQGRDYYIAWSSSRKSVIARADVNHGELPFVRFPQDVMIRALQSVRGKVAPVCIKIIQHEDNYYYSKHNDNPLPVLRIQYNDADQTWYYADPATGVVVLKNTSSSRLSRWLYHGLHSLDFFNLQHYRPWWDVLMFVLLTGGTAVSVTGLILGLKYIRRTVEK